MDKNGKYSQHSRGIFEIDKQQGEIGENRDSECCGLNRKGKISPNQK